MYCLHFLRFFKDAFFLKSSYCLVRRQECPRYVGADFSKVLSFGLGGGENEFAIII